MECRYCGSEQVEYHGAVDGAGDYGEAVCDEWECHACGQYFDGDCIGAVDGVMDDDFEARKPDDQAHETQCNLCTSPVKIDDDVGDIPF